jgi:hypothetical protein
MLHACQEQSELWGHTAASLNKCECSRGYCRKGADYAWTSGRALQCGSKELPTVHDVHAVCDMQAACRLLPCSGIGQY